MKLKSDTEYILKTGHTIADDGTIPITKIQEIVRCKECKHRDITSKFECDFSSVFVFDDHYCSYGERMEET